MGFSIEVCLGEGFNNKDFLSKNITFSQPESIVPKSFLRRSSVLTKQVLSLSDFVFSSKPNFIVFATRHGELSRTLSLLYAIAEHSELSPTQFSQSVHSTAAGVLTIANKQPIPFTTVCAGQQTIVMAMVEAVSHLRNFPQQEVCIIFADEAVPKELEQFVGEGGKHAMAIKLRSGKEYLVDMVAANDNATETSDMENIDHMLSQLAINGPFTLQSPSINIMWKPRASEHTTA